MDQVTPDPFVPGDEPRFRYRVRSRATLPASFILTPDVTVPAWRPLLRVENEAGNIIPSVELLPEAQATVFVVLGPLPVGSTGTMFSLTLAAASGAVTGFDSDNFTVGEDVIEEDPDVELNVSDFTPGPGSVGTRVGNTIHLSSGFGSLTLQAIFDRADNYTFSAQLLPPTSGWNVLIRDNRTSFPVTVSPQEETPIVDIQVTGAASATGQLLLTMSGEDRGDFGPKTLLVNLSRTMPT